MKGPWMKKSRERERAYGMKGEKWSLEGHGFFG
jgi:hypothetical protein